MGGSTFYDFAEGSTRKKAFSAVVKQAQYDYGHAGYTGTIAEKSDFVVVGSAKTQPEALELAESLMDEDDRRISDKWGPAGCIDIEDGTYLFFGIASS